MRHIVNFTSICFLIVSSIFLIIVVYKFDILNLDELNSQKIKYFLISFFLFFLSIIILFLETENKKGSLLVIVSMTFSLYLVEIILTYFNYKESVKYHAIKSNHKFDERSRYEYFEILREKDNSYVVTIPPYVFDRNYKKISNELTFFPLGGISNSNTLFCNETGFFVKYKSDRYGFNNDDKEWDKKSQILFIGDSYTHGVCVDRKDNITGFLRKHINENVGLINLGQRGNGPLIELASLIEYGLVVNPKKIFWLYYEGNDLKNLEKEIAHPILKNYLSHDFFSQNLKLKQIEIDNLLKKILIERLKFEKLTRSNNYKNKFYRFVKLENTQNLLKKLNFKKEKDYTQSEIKNLRLILNRAKQITDNLDAEFHFVYIPSYKRIKLKKHKDINLFDYENVKKIVYDLNINFIDLSKPMIYQSEDPYIFYPYKLPKHFNKLGYQKIGEIILNYAKN